MYTQTPSTTLLATDGQLHDAHDVHHDHAPTRPFSGSHVDRAVFMYRKEGRVPARVRIYTPAQVVGESHD